MLLAPRLAPVGFHATIEETRRAQGAHGVVDLIMGKLTSRRLRDAEIDEHLTILKSACRQTRRYREALPVLHRVAALNPDRRHEMAAEIALVHWHLGERSMAVTTLETAVAEQGSLPAWKRSLAFSLIAEVAATVIGRPDLAVVCAQLGRSSFTPAPRRARATAAASAPTAAPSVGRRRAKGPVRQLSVLTPANQSPRSQLTVVKGAAA